MMFFQFLYCVKKLEIVIESFPDSDNAKCSHEIHAHSCSRPPTGTYEVVMNLFLISRTAGKDYHRNLWTF